MLPSTALAQLTQLHLYIEYTYLHLLQNFMLNIGGGGGAKNTNLNVFGEYGWGVTSQVPRSSYSNVCALILLYTANNLAHNCAMKSDSQCG